MCRLFIRAGIFYSLKILKKRKYCIRCDVYQKSVLKIFINCVTVEKLMDGKTALDKGGFWIKA